MGRKVNRVLLWALAVSLVAHLLMLGSAGGFWITPAKELAFPIEARLVEPEPPVVEPVSPVRSRVRQPPSPLPVVLPELAPHAAPAQESAASEEMVPSPELLPEPASMAPEPVVVPPPAPRPPARAVARALPDSLVLHYSVQTGEGESGFIAGRATYVWHHRGGRYSLVSTVEATGLASLFISGRIIQVSEGSIADGGLRPEQYWLQRNERKQDVARFNWDMNHLVLGARGGVALPAQTQDLLSFPFHLAMTAREGEADFLLGVTNGRKLNEYGFRVLGRERVEMQGRRFDALHLQGAKEGEGTLDVWLDLDRSGLPARILTLDRKGKVMELRLEGAGQAAGGSGG